MRIALLCLPDRSVKRSPFKGELGLTPRTPLPTANDQKSSKIQVFWGRGVIHQQMEHFHLTHGTPLPTASDQKSSKIQVFWGRGVIHQQMKRFRLPQPTIKWGCKVSDVGHEKLQSSVLILFLCIFAVWARLGMVDLWGP